MHTCVLKVFWEQLLSRLLNFMYIITGKTKIRENSSLRSGGGANSVAVCCHLSNSRNVAWAASRLTKEIFVKQFCYMYMLGIYVSCGHFHSCLLLWYAKLFTCGNELLLECPLRPWDICCIVMSCAWMCILQINQCDYNSGVFLFSATH